MYDKALELIKVSEGFRAKAYKCPAGIWTIGYGTTKGVHSGDTITKEKAEELVKQSMSEIIVQLKHEIGSTIFDELTENQVCALIDFIYNLGIGTFRKSSLCKYIKQGDLDKAGTVFEKYIYAGKKVLPGLVTRRAAEKELWYS